MKEILLATTFALFLSTTEAIELNCQSTNTEDGTILYTLTYKGVNRPLPQHCSSGQGNLIIRTKYLGKFHENESTGNAKGEMGHSDCGMAGLMFTGLAVDQDPISNADIFKVVRYLPFPSSHTFNDTLILHVGNGIERAKEVSLKCKKIEEESDFNR